MRCVDEEQKGELKRTLKELHMERSRGGQWACVRQEEGRI